MGFIQKLLNWKKNIEEPEYEIYDWNEIVYDRDDLNVHDKTQREEYVRGCLEQIAEASKELETLQFEYNMVTSYLKDMEEIEALPPEEKAELEEVAKKIEKVESDKEGYQRKKNRMSDAQFHQMDRLSDDVQEGFEKLEAAEDYQTLIKTDLRRLDGEKQAYFFRRTELRHAIEDTRGMVVICIVALISCILLLAILQMGFGMNTQIGYFIMAAIAAVAITLIYIKHSDSVSELKRVENGINRIILLQNTVKIRYVNNTNLLDYLYLKYEVSSASQLGKLWEQYQEEREERDKFREAEKELDLCQKDLMHVLRRYQVKDPAIWLHQTAAILNKKEMVEIRHNLIIRRQSLRRRMDYNKEVIAGKAQAEIKDLVEQYPKYSREILDIVGDYEKDFT